jgi:putative hemolysin
MLGMAEELSASLGFALVIGVTTYASLVIGELVPETICARSAEKNRNPCNLPVGFAVKV